MRKIKVVEINGVAKGSTGKIMLNIADLVRKNGGAAVTFSEVNYGVLKINGHVFFGNRVENLLHRLYSVLSGVSGTGSRYGTKKLITQIKKINPDVIHLHNLHGWYVNIPMLIDFIKESKIKTVWTLHDCWGFTAQCSHFVIEKCEKWKSGCFSCPRYRVYPYTWVDKTRAMWKIKKGWFSGIENLTIVTPSNWLAGLVKESFLKDYPVKVINNGIDLSIFKPTESNFRKKYDLVGKKVILGVAFDWGYRKGLDVFVELSKRLDPNTYKIVLVGTNDEVEKQLPTDIISIHRTQNQSELAEIYTAADVLAQPTREENYPTVNMEALACGTPVVTFKTGGSPEIVDETCGSVVDCDDVDAMEREIIRICTDRSYSKEACLKRAEEFDMNVTFMEYYKLFNSLL